MKVDTRKVSQADEVDGLDQPRDRFFCPWRIPKSGAALKLVGDVLNQITRFEQHRRPRTRARRAVDQLVFERTVAAIVCDLIHAQLVGDPAIAVSRSNRELGRKSRYRSAVLGKQLPHVLDLMAAPEMAFVDAELGFKNPFGRNQRTLIRPGKRLIERIEDHRLDLSDLGHDPDEEVIVLRGEREHPNREPEQLEYDDTPQTMAIRQQLRRLNAFLEAAKLTIALEREHDRTDKQQRRLQRFFTRGSFTSGGRLFGGFWLDLKKDDRRRGLLIDDESTVELDFGQMAPSLLYSYVGARPTVDDAYLLPSLPVPSLFREGVKKLFNALLFSEGPLVRKPQGTRKLLPRHVSIEQLVEELRLLHRPIAHLFGTGIGHHIQFLESELLLEVLDKAMEQGVVALPIHDAIIVKHSSAARARQLMEEVFERRTGFMPSIKALLPFGVMEEEREIVSL